MYMDVGFEDQKTKAEGVERIIDVHARERVAGISGWFVKRGIVKNQRAAEVYILLLVLLCIFATVYILLAALVQKFSVPPGMHLIQKKGVPAYLEGIR